MERPQPFGDLVKELAHQKGWSIERLGHEAWRPEPRTGTSPALLRKVLSGQRALTPTLIEAVADALEVRPTVFA